MRTQKSRAGCRSRFQGRDEKTSPRFSVMGLFSAMASSQTSPKASGTSVGIVAEGRRGGGNGGVFQAVFPAS